MRKKWHTLNLTCNDIEDYLHNCLTFLKQIIHSKSDLHRIR